MSEDSGYGDQLLSSMSRVSEQEKTRNSLSDNLHEMTEHPMTVNRRGYQKDRNSVGFGAYDCDVFQVGSITEDGKARDLSSNGFLHRIFNNILH